jgi:hypothetical protein
VFKTWGWKNMGDCGNIPFFSGIFVVSYKFSESSGIDFYKDIKEYS